MLFPHTLLEEQYIRTAFLMGILIVYIKVWNADVLKLSDSSSRYATYLHMCRKQPLHDAHYSIVHYSKNIETHQNA